MCTPVILRQPSFDSLSQEQRLPESIATSFTPPPIKRVKIWDLDQSFHCPIIGLCLSIEDLDRFAKRFHFDAPINNKYALHVEAVCRISSRNRVAETLQKYLDRLYQGYIKQFEAAKTDNDVLLLWQEYFSTGKVAGPMWAALTHKRISNENREQIHDRIHMHMHQAVNELSVAQCRINEVEQTLSKMVGHQEQIKEQHSRTETQLRQRLEQSLTEIGQLQQYRRESEMLRQRLEKLESGHAMLNIGQRLMQLATENEQLRIKAERASELKQSLKIACHNLTELYRERDNLRLERDTLENLLLMNNSNNDSDTGASASRTRESSCLCILCVGGRSTLLPQYRVLARQLGLELSHHDGGQEDALSRLPEMIYSAKAVICPTDCVSHAAYYQVKRLCRLGRKPCLLFKGTGVSSFTAALAKIASGKASINGSAIESAQIIT